MNAGPAARGEPRQPGRRRLCRAAAAVPALVGGLPLLSALSALSAAWPARAAAAPLAAAETVRWPALTLIDGGRIAPADWRDTAAVVVLWETTCPFCRRHNAHVEKLHRAAAGKRLRVLTAAKDRDAAAVRQYMASQGYTFPVTLQEPALRELFTPRRVIPMTCSVGRDGRLREVIAGEMFEEDLLAMLALAA